MTTADAASYPAVSENDVREQLQRLGERRQDAIAEHEQASSELRAVIRRAADEDVPVTEIARLAQISRQGVWQILRGE